MPRQCTKAPREDWTWRVANCMWITQLNAVAMEVRSNFSDAKSLNISQVKRKFPKLTPLFTQRCY